MCEEKQDNEDVWEQTAENALKSRLTGYAIINTQDGKIICNRYNERYDLTINLEFESVRTGNTKKLMELLSIAYMEKLQEKKQDILKDESSEK